MQGRTDRQSKASCRDRTRVAWSGVVLKTAAAGTLRFANITVGGKFKGKGSMTKPRAQSPLAPPTLLQALATSNCRRYDFNENLADLVREILAKLMKIGRARSVEYTRRDGLTTQRTEKKTDDDDDDAPLASWAPGKTKRPPSRRPPPAPPSSCHRRATRAPVMSDHAMPPTTIVLRFRLNPG